jgi:YfiH family protein
VTTTRAGGVSAAPFDTFNLGDHVGDDPAAVAANRKRLTAAIGLGDDRVVWMNQVHGDHVVAVDGPVNVAVEQTDALVTGTPRLALAVVTADCVPVLLGDARAGVVAAVHAGRVGAQKGVVARTVEAMLRAGAHVEDVSVLLGPAVSGRNYEVPADMANEVEATLPGSRTTTARGTPGLDLRAGIARQLTDLGITAIDIDPRCTVDDRHLFSHRRDAPTGRLASLVWME